MEVLAKPTSMAMGFVTMTVSRDVRMKLPATMTPVLLLMMVVVISRAVTDVQTLLRVTTPEQPI